MNQVFPAEIRQVTGGCDEKTRRDLLAALTVFFSMVLLYHPATADTSMVQSGLHTMVREMIDPSLGAKPDAYGPAPGALVQSYVSYPGGENVTDWNLSQGWAAGGIISTASDLRLFLRALAHGMVFARPETLSVMADFFETEAIRIHNGSLGYARGPH
jgi:hypothetical protein